MQHQGVDEMGVLLPLKWTSFLLCYNIVMAEKEIWPRIFCRERNRPAYHLRTKTAVYLLLRKKTARVSHEKENGPRIFCWERKRPTQHTKKVNYPCILCEKENGPRIFCWERKLSMCVLLRKKMGHVSFEKGKGPWIICERKRTTYLRLRKKTARASAEKENGSCIFYWEGKWAMYLLPE